MCVRKKMRELNECEKKGGNRMCVGKKRGKKEGRQLNVFEKKGGN